MTTGKLEPAVGRLLVTRHGEVWQIKAIHDDGTMDLTDPYTGLRLYNERQRPDEGDWIAQDMLAVETWSRLTGVELI